MFTVQNYGIILINRTNKLQDNCGVFVFVCACSTYCAVAVLCIFEYVNLSIVTNLETQILAYFGFSFENMEVQNDYHCPMTGQSILWSSQQENRK